MGKTFKEIQDMVTEPWSNDACRGQTVLMLHNIVVRGYQWYNIVVGWQLHSGLRNHDGAVPAVRCRVCIVHGEV